MTQITPTATATIPPTGTASSRNNPKSATAGSEGEVGIGVTIPEDIRTDIIELRRSSDNLEQYVNVEGVVTKTGSKKEQELYYDEYYYPDDEFAERMSVVVWFILSLGCAILWVGIPLLICGLIVYTELEEHCPELMGDMTDRNTEEFDKEENK